MKKILFFLSSMINYANGMGGLISKLSVYEAHKNSCKDLANCTAMGGGKEAKHWWK